MRELLYDKRDGYVVLRLNRPERLNALDSTLRVLLDEAVADLAADPDVRCAVITGEGRAFSTGGDLKAMSAVPLTPESATSSLTAMHRFSRCPKPVIAAINGACIAGGLETAIDCDIRICSSEAFFGLFEVKRGIMPGYAIHNLARVIPFGAAMYLMLSADRVDADWALRNGLVQEVLAPADLMPRAVAMAEMIAANAPFAVEGTKAAAHYWRQLQLDEAIRQGRWIWEHVLSSADAREGPRAFAEKRAAAWAPNEMTAAGTGAPP